jgi:hypothetical protein
MLVIYLTKTRIDEEIVPAEEVLYEEFVEAEEAIKREEI